MNKKPVCVTATYLHSYNYGAVLQAYSLNQVLKNEGFTSIYLDIPKAEKLFDTPIRFNNMVAIKRSIIRLLSILHKHELNRMYNQFDEFIRKNFKTANTVHGIPKADCFLSGSDQVFSMRLDQNLRSLFLLDFDSGNAIKSSYAASLAEYDLSQTERSEFSRMLRNFQLISVREKAAADYLKELAEKPIETNIDPTFLTPKEQWLSLIRDVPVQRFPERYILLIVVTDNSAINQTIKDIKNSLGGIPVVCIRTTPIKTMKADCYCFDASPEEWVYAIANAEYVITSSFHGTCFSIIMEKQFSVVTKEKANPVRINDLLTRFNLQDRIIYTSTSTDCIQKKIDYDPIRIIIEKERNASIKFIHDLHDLASQRIKDPTI